MSLYGSGIYGISTYGDSQLIPYDIQFKATTVDYRSVELSWKDTQISSSEKLYAWKIIKSYGNAPDYPNQGIIVGTPYSTDTPSFGSSLRNGKVTDYDSSFNSGAIITYSFWALLGPDLNNASWRLLGADDAVILDTESDDTTLRILRLLPGAWSNNSFDSLGEPDTDTDLYTFVGSFGFYYDKLKAQIDQVNSMSDYRKFPKRLLPAAVTTLGFSYEDILGDRSHRALYKQGNLINSLKGTYLGINNYIKALTGFHSKISIGRNLMLDYLQSSFEGSVGTWAPVASGSTFTYGSRAAAPLSSPTLPFSGSVLSDGYGILTKSSGSSPVLISYTSTSTTDTITKTIPVIPGAPYYFSGWALKSGSTANITVQAQIDWFDSTGTLISSATAGTAVTLTTSWKKFESSSSYSAIFAPTKAAYAGVKITTANMANTDTLYFDNFLFSIFPGLIGNKEFGSGDVIYEDARNININLEGYRTNLISNPGFEDGTGFWNAKNGTLLSAETSSALMTGSTRIGRFLPTSVGSNAIYTNWIRNLKPGKEYTFSIYVIAPSVGSTATANIEWDMPKSIDKQQAITTSTTAGYEGKYRPTVSKIVSSSPVPFSTLSWTRISVTGTAPDFTTVNGFPSAIVSVTFTAGSTNEFWYFDCALFEESPTVNTYFQGNGGITPAFTIPSGGSLASIITDDFIPVSDTAWETKARTNFVYNPSFENSTNFYTTTSTGTGSSATLSTITSETVGSLTFTPKISGGGNNFGKIATGSTTTSSTLVTSFKYPSLTTTGGTVANMPTGGEAFSVSAYVTSAVVGTYTITFTDVTSGNAYSNSFLVNTASASWNRINVTGYLGKPITLYPRGTVSITFTPAISPAAIAWYVDGVQAEYGSEPTTFVNPNDASTVSSLNKAESLLGTATTTSSISGAVINSPATDFVTYTTATPHNISPGDTLTISGVSVPGTQTITAITKNSTPSWSSTLQSLTNTNFKIGPLRLLSTAVSLAINTYTSTGGGGFYAIADQTLGSFPTSTTSLYVFLSTSSTGEAVITPKTQNTVISIDSASGTGSTQTYVYSAAVQVFATGQTLSVTGFSPNGYNVTNATVTSVATITSGSQYSVSVSGSTTGATSGSGSITTSTGGSENPLIPVVAGRRYSASIKGIQGGSTTGRNVTLNINWVDSSGTLISTTSGTATRLPVWYTQTITSGSGSALTSSSANTTGLVAGTSTNPGSQIVGTGGNTEYQPYGNTITAISGTSGAYTLTMQYPLNASASTSRSMSFTNPVTFTAEGNAPAGAVSAYISLSLGTGGNNNNYFNYAKFIDVTPTTFTVGSVANYSAGQSITVSGASPYDATYTITGVNSGANTFTVDTTTTGTATLNGSSLVTIPNNFNGTFVAAVNNITPYKFAVPVSVNYTTPSGGTVAVTNSTTNKNSYASTSIMNSLGRSYYWPNIGLKYSRLINTISKYLPIGSTYTVTKGIPSEPKNELIGSIAPSYSFETNLYGWSGQTNNTLSRYVSSGTLGTISGFSSASWMVAANTAGSGVIGATTEFHIKPRTRYQFAASIYAPTSATASTRTGTANITVSWYTDNTKTTQVYPEGSSTSTNVTPSEVSSRNAENRWAVIGGYATSPSTAFYAVVSISYTPSSFSSTTSDNIIYIDDVICSL